jgi:hypothetical protein
MFRNVLVGYEGSERSEDALVLGHELAAADGTVTAVCAYWYEPLSSRVGPGGPGETTMRAGAEETLAPLRDRSDAAAETLAIRAASPAHRRYAGLRTPFGIRRDRRGPGIWGFDIDASGSR